MIANDSTALAPESTATRTASSGTKLLCQIRICPKPSLSACSAPASVATIEAPPPVPGRSPGKCLWLALFSLVPLAVILSLGYRWVQHALAYVKTDNAYVAAHIHQVSARVSGTVKGVLIQENQEVEAGTVLARLDRQDFEVRRNQALAQLAQAQAKVRQAEAQTSQAHAQVAQAQAHSTKALQDLGRAKVLYDGTWGAISQQEFENAKATADAAEANFQAAKSALESARASEIATKAQEQAAKADLQDAELQLQYTDILAPAAGRIGKKNLETGNRILPGQPLLALVQPDIWVVANLKETQLARVKPGQPVNIRIDAFPGRLFPGRVESLSPASGSQFALLPPDNATGNFTKVVQRVPVKVVFETGSLGKFANRVVPGMSTLVEIKVRD